MNIPIDLSQFPQVAHLNRAQKRALILRDQLKFLDPAHLDTYLDGLDDPEPPAYRLVNGQVQPPLTEITLKEGKDKLDLGNVRFRRNKQIRRVHLIIENGVCEMRESEAHPEDDANLESVAIECWIAENIIPLFRAKYEAIDMRKHSLNETRCFAYQAANQPRIRTSDGKSLSKLSANEGDRDGSSVNGKRRTSSDITRHVANKRGRVSLESIPDNIKSGTFDSIPEQVKVDIFNNIVKAAFPNFDNLMMASWNVVTVYENVGSEDRHLHRAICDLKTVLCDFEADHGKSKALTAIQAKKSQKPNTPQLGTPQNGNVDQAANSTGNKSSGIKHNTVKDSANQPKRESTDGGGEIMGRNPYSNRRKADTHQSYSQPSSKRSSQKAHDQLELFKAPGISGVSSSRQPVVGNDLDPPRSHAGLFSSSTTEGRNSRLLHEESEAYDDGLSSLFEDDDQDVPVLSAPSANRSEPHLGNSKLGPPKRAPWHPNPENATPPAPVAPMLCTPKDSDGEEPRGAKDWD